MNAPFTPPGQVRAPFSAYLSDEASAEVARAAAQALNCPVDSVGGGGVRTAIQALAVAASPAVLLVDLSECADPMEDVNGLAEVCEPGTIVIACGRLNDIRFYRELIGSGIHDYLHKPFTADQLRDTVEQARALASSAAAAVEAVGEVAHTQAVVIGVRGGSGASTLAVSVAWGVAQAKRSTALLDLDVHFGTGALALDLEPGRGLTDAVENPSRIDGLFIERALVRASDQLGVLSAEAPITQALTGDGTAFLQLQDEFRHAFACSVVDLPRHMLVQHPALLHDAGVVVLVTELTLAATRDTIRLLSWLKANAPRSRVVLVANKVPPAGQEEVARKEFEKSVEHKLDVVLPNEPKLAAQAAKLGKPLADVAKGTKFAAAFAPLLATVLGDAAGPVAARKGGSLLNRLADVRGLLPSKAKA